MTDAAITLSMDDDGNEAWLIYDVSRRMRRLIDRRAQAIGLTRAQWVALVTIRRHEGIRQTDLAELLDVEPMTLARLLDRLQGAGYVERREDEKDRRAKRIYLTRDVQGILETMRGLILETRYELVDGLTQNEHDELLRLLKKVKCNTARLLGGA